ncbi:MAG: iron-containing alcohol dehydrogenase [Clostridia bacterium]|nr:iron-containing alcohol dehydrogenase [Clostridia bacterium]
MYVGLAVMKWREPERIMGAGCLKDVAEKLQGLGLKRPLIVTDEYLDSIKIYAPLTEEMDKLGIPYSIYGKAVPNPTVHNIADAYKIFVDDGCDCLIAVGGGSSMDCAKGVGAQAANPKRTLAQMKGLLKVGKDIPTLFAVPTTAGTGSEVTVTAVITNPENRDKYLMNDLHLIPHYAVLDPTLTYKLPKHITSTTGLDTLTHAVEAYIGSANTKRTKENAIEAVKLVFENLYAAYEDGFNEDARQNMQIASYRAGLAFTRAYVGTVHALAHAIGGFYGVPHGLANSILLPVVLRAYGKSAHKKLAQLADLIGIEGATAAEKANKFIDAIEDLNKKMEIPTKIEGKWTIKEEDLPALAKHAFDETNPLYPVPKIFSEKELIAIYRSVM